MKPVPRQLLDFLDTYQTYYVIGHKEPDGDCVGSQLALASFLRRTGKAAVVCSAGPFTRSEIAAYQELFSPVVPPEKDCERAAALILDCSSISRIGSIADSLPPVPRAFIDHHAAGEASGDVIYIDPAATSVTSMVLRIIEASGVKPTREEAGLLFFGLCTDTGFFRHLDENGAETFETAARLAAAGASPKLAFRQMYGGKSLQSRRLMGEILSRAEALYGGALLVSHVTLEDQKRYGLASRDSDMLYQLLFGVAGCEAAMVIRQESETECTVGLRALERVDVGSIAACLGGGGHRLAAGLLIRGKISDVSAALVAAFAPYFPGKKVREE